VSELKKSTDQLKRREEGGEKIELQEAIAISKQLRRKKSRTNPALL